jgi:hypothetical protein
MAKPKATEQEFIAAYRELQSATKVAEHFGMSETRVRKRREFIETKYGMRLPTFDPRPSYNRAYQEQKEVAKLAIENGTVLIGSDIHIWPNHRTTMQRAFVQFAKALKPTAIVLNGDVADFPSISRHPSIGWEKIPTVQEEIEAIRDWLEEVIQASPNSRRIWAAGNHDLRFESRIANVLPQAAGIEGMHLKDHFPGWTPCWRVDINNDTVVRHREFGGEHADWTNVMKSGKTIVTGHDHRAGVVFYSDYTGLRFGVRTGYMCDSPMDPQFSNYLEGRMPNWHAAFVLLTYVNSKLLVPELAIKLDDDHVQWRGGIVKVESQRPKNSSQMLAKRVAGHSLA